MKLRIAVSIGLLVLFLSLSQSSIFERQARQHSPDGNGSSSRSQAEIKFQVVGYDDQTGIAGALVTLTAPGRVVHSGQTNGAGKVALPFFRLEGFPYRLRIRHEDFVAIDWRIPESWISIQKVQRIRLTAKDELRTVRVGFSTMAGENVLVVWNWHLFGTGLVSPGDSGRTSCRASRGFADLTLSGVPCGATLRLVATGMSTGAGDRVEIDIEADLKAVARRLKRTFLAGRIEDPTGRAIENVAVRFLAPYEIGPNPGLRARTNEMGEFQVVLPTWLVEKNGAAGELGVCDLQVEGRLIPGLPLFRSGEDLKTIRIPEG